MIRISVGKYWRDWALIGALLLRGLFLFLLMLWWVVLIGVHTLYPSGLPCCIHWEKIQRKGRPLLYNPD